MKKPKMLMSCDRCGEDFIFNISENASFASCFSSSKLALRFKSENPKKINLPLTRHKYIDYYSINKDYSNIESETTGILNMCEECDRAYWENFEKAMDILKSFWRKPDSVVDADFEESK